MSKDEIFETEVCPSQSRQGGSTKQPLVVRIESRDFEREVLEKLARLETKMDMLAGGAQPGRMKMAEDRLLALEKFEAGRSMIDRLVSAAIAFLVSAAIALHDHLGLK